MSLPERRTKCRLECHVFIHYRIKSKETFRAAIARDISEQGIKFKVKEKLPLNAIIWTVIQLPLYVDPIKTKARVVSISEVNQNCEIGVCFLSIPEGSRAQIARYIKQITSAHDQTADIIEVPEEPIFEENSPVPSVNFDLEKERSLDAQELAGITEEIESLEMVIDQEKDVCKLGEFATFSLKELAGCPPMMLAFKFKDAVIQSFLGKYEISEKEITELLDECHKKFKSLGTSCFVRGIRRPEKEI